MARTRTRHRAGRAPRAQKEMRSAMASRMGRRVRLVLAVCGSAGARCPAGAHNTRGSERADGALDTAARQPSQIAHARGNVRAASTFGCT
eukprot:2763275-Prymnesium_polylepis.1